MRMGDRVAVASPVATAAGPTPQTAAAAAAARAQETRCSPGAGRVTGAVPDGVTRVKLARPSPPRVTDSALTSAPGPWPKVTTRATVRSAMAATWGSSALRTAVPSGGRDSTSSPLALAIASRDPNIPRWDSPTLTTTPTDGRARRARAAMWPGPRAPISTTTARVPGSIRVRVRGRPTSLLNDAWLATVATVVARAAASRSLVVVLPLDPVTATTVAAERPRTAVPRAARAASGSATSTRGPAKTVPSWA